MLTCRECRTKIETAARADDLTARGAAHLNVCGACRQFQTERRRLRALVGELEPVAAPPDFEFRLRARIAARESKPAARFAWPDFAPRALGLAFAACLILAVVATLRRHNQTSLPAGAPVAAQRTVGRQAAPAQVEQRNSEATSTARINSDDDPILVPIEKTQTRGQRHTQAIEHVGSSRSVPRDALGANERTESENFGVGSAPLATSAVVDNAPATLATISLPVNSSAPLRVTLRDLQGTARTISVDPVSFGARDLLGTHARVVRASANDSQGVW
jgi:hypothetical protein